MFHTLQPLGTSGVTLPKNPVPIHSFTNPCFFGFDAFARAYTSISYLLSLISYLLFRARPAPPTYVCRITCYRHAQTLASDSSAAGVALAPSACLALKP